jgi:hypothetical protein
LGALSRLYRTYSEAVTFFVVYIREAHPEDGWVLTANREEGVAVADPRTLDERRGVAEACAVKSALEIPVLVDELGDDVARQYGGWPDRLYLIGTDGTVVYQGGPGPFGFDVAALEAAIERELASAAA